MMAKVLKFHPDPPSERKSGFKKVQKKLNRSLEEQGQLNLFNRESQPSEAKQIKISSFRSPFEEALVLDEKDDPKAIEAYQKLIQQRIDVADAYCNLGILYASNGESIQAINSFTLALKEDPRHIESHYNLGNMYFDAGNYQLAITHYEIAKGIDADFPDLLFNLTLAYAIQKQFEKALEMIRAYQKTSGASQTEVQILMQFLNDR
jgi:tetratricopeptide (TPR) repeat protein